MDYDVIYTNRKTIALRVSKCKRLIVRAPIGTTKAVIDKLIQDKHAWIEKQMKKQYPTREVIESLTDADKARIKKEAKLYFEIKTECYARMMGLKYSRIKITSAMVRFGSCNSEGLICYSYRLMLYPERAREYVIVHELAHLVHMDHSKEFYNYIALYMPDYKEREGLLLN